MGFAGLIQSKTHDVSRASATKIRLRNQWERNKKIIIMIIIIIIIIIKKSVLDQSFLK